MLITGNKFIFAHCDTYISTHVHMYIDSYVHKLNLISATLQNCVSIENLQLSEHK